MAVLLNASGKPEPSPEIRRRLAAIHGNLDLMFVEGISSHWAITMKWSNDDRRMEWVQNGRTNPAKAFDIIGYLPLDCSVDEAPAYLARMLREFPRLDVNELLGRLDAYNAAPAAKAAEEALAEVLDSKDPSKAEGVKPMVVVPEAKAEEPKKTTRRKTTKAKSKYL